MFFNCRNGQGHFLRYFQHGFFLDAAEDEDPAALGGERLDDRLDLPQRLAGMQLRFHIVLATQQLQIGDRFETHHLVAAGGVDHEVSGDGEQIGPTRRHILPIFRGIGAGHNFGDHVVQLVGGGQDAPETAAQRGFLRQDDGLEPFQLCPNPMHVDPLDCQPRLSCFLLFVIVQSCLQGAVQRAEGHFLTIGPEVPGRRKFIVDMCPAAHSSCRPLP